MWKINMCKWPLRAVVEQKRGAASAAGARMVFSSSRLSGWFPSSLWPQGQGLELTELEHIRRFAGQKKESILQILYLTAMYSYIKHTVMLSCLEYGLVMQESAPKYSTSASIELPKI